MILKIPFYKNDGDGNRCMQVCMKSAIKHFLGKEVSLEELDSLTGRKVGLWTYPQQIVTVLHNMGLKVHYYTKEDLNDFLQGETFIRKHYKDDAEKILQHSNLPIVIEATKRLIELNVTTKKIISLDEIKRHIEEGNIPFVLIDHNRIIGKEGLYQGHLVVVTGFDEDNIYYHESGPDNLEPNKKVPTLLFQEAMDANGTDNDCIMVYGKL